MFLPILLSGDIEVKKIKTFEMAEKLLGKDWVYMHIYGRLPCNEVLSRIQCDEFLSFPDYDFIGLFEIYGTT